MDIRIGKQLTQARESLGLVVEDVAHRTRIPAAVVRQLESEDFSQFPNNVYAKSFLRLYSRHLGIDASPFIAEHNGQLKDRDDEVAFLDGIAVSPEFKGEEAIAAASPAAVAAVEATKMEAPAGKISSGFMTVFLLVVVGVPTAFLLSKLYGEGDQQPDAGEPPPGDVAEGKPTPPPPTIAPEDEGAPATGPGPEGVPLAVTPEGDGGPATSAATLNPPVETPQVLPAVSIDAPPEGLSPEDEPEVIPRAQPVEPDPAADAADPDGQPLAARPVSE